MPICVRASYFPQHGFWLYLFTRVKVRQGQRSHFRSKLSSHFVLDISIRKALWVLQPFSSFTLLFDYFLKYCEHWPHKQSLDVITRDQTKFVLSAFKIHFCVFLLAAYDFFVNLWMLGWLRIGTLFVLNGPCQNHWSGFAIKTYLAMLLTPTC